MAVKNAVYKVDNGAGAFDEIMFKTLAQMVSINGGGNLQEWLNSIVVEAGYDKYYTLKIGKLLIQASFKTMNGDTQPYGERVTFRHKYAEMPVIIASPFNKDYSTPPTLVHGTNEYFNFSTGPGAGHLTWVAIGHTD